MVACISFLNSDYKMKQEDAKEIQDNKEIKNSVFITTD